jgi:hypothetical protein
MALQLLTFFLSCGLSRQLRVRILYLLLLRWLAYAIAANCCVHLLTVYNQANNLL